MIARRIRRVLALMIAAVSVLAAPALAGPRALVVTKRAVPYPHFRTIQAALRAARPGDWVLIAPGRYVGPVLISKPRLHLVGLDRNRVVIDGRHRREVNGIEVLKADRVTIENLTVRNFDANPRTGEEGNQIWWNGGDESGRIGMHGWRGSYLTAYSTDLNAFYGLFVSNAVDGSMDHVYASGMADSGVYIGACRDCRATVDRAVVERSALGYSGANSGGHIVVEHSIFRHNSNGVVMASELDDPPPPQDGACSSKANRSSTPTFASTRIGRCTIFRDDRVEDNSDLAVPADLPNRQLPWGNGFLLAGTYGDLIEHNVIGGNANFGLLGFENPNPFPPTSKTVYFQLSGNRVSANHFRANGTNANNRFAADIGIEGGAFGQQRSTNNCFSANTLASSHPANIQDTWGCQHPTTPNPGGQLLQEILALQAQSQTRQPRAQPAPKRQPTMPHPCQGAPPNPVCGS